jgi:hypothetical protein
LTQGQFIKELKPGMGYAVIEAGEFQVYVGEFKKLMTYALKEVDPTAYNCGFADWASEQEEEAEDDD